MPLPDLSINFWGRPHKTTTAVVISTLSERRFFGNTAFSGYGECVKTETIPFSPIPIGFDFVTYNGV